MLADRNMALVRLSDEQFDLVVIGGGITGACVAYDAAMRGLRVALVEKNDFGSATSASSSKLLHGGIRYLQSLRIGKVRESANERIFFQNIAPHLCRYIPFLIPAFHGLTTNKLALRSALLVYGLAAVGQNRAARLPESRVPPPRIITDQELLEQIPWLESRSDLCGGAELPECHMINSERMTLSVISGAVENGCLAVNYAVATNIESRAGKVRSLTIKDGESGDEIEIRTRLVANCAGPWIGSVNQSALRGGRNPVTSVSRGSHLVLRGLNLTSALGLPTGQAIEGVAGRGGRHMFLIPWRDHVLLGTSYSAHDRSMDRVEPTVDDARQLVDGMNSAVGKRVIGPENLAYAYSGLYPLTTDSVKEGVYQGTGDYQIIDHADADSVSGLYSVFGAKFTTARLVAEKACDRMLPMLEGTFSRCETRTKAVQAGAFDSLARLVAELNDKYQSLVDVADIESLARMYGTEAEEVLEIIKSKPGLGRRVSAERETLRAEAVFAARSEMLVHLSDFVFRRTGLGTIGDPGIEVIRDCAKLIGEELGWSAPRSESEIGAVIRQFDVVEEIRASL